MSERYLIGNLVGFVQQIHHLVSRGYGEFCLIKYPEKKEDKFLKIDEKLINKYGANMNKDRAYYNKKRGYCNFKFLRCKDVGIILKTKGVVNEKITLDDVFLDITKEKIPIKFGERTTLKIGYDHKRVLTVFLDNDTYRTVKVTCFEYIDVNEFYKAANTFNNLNGLPCWGGIISQKIKMKEQLLGKMKKRISKEQINVFSKKMIINTKRTAVKVF